MNIIEYSLVREENAQEFVNLVNEALRQGWQPFGAPYVNSKEHDGIRHYQCLVKYAVPIFTPETPVRLLSDPPQ